MGFQVVGELLFLVIKKGYYENDSLVDYGYGYSINGDFLGLVIGGKLLEKNESSKILARKRLENL